MPLSQETCQLKGAGGAHLEKISGDRRKGPEALAPQSNGLTLAEPVSPAQRPAGPTQTKAHPRPHPGIAAAGSCRQFSTLSPDRPATPGAHATRVGGAADSRRGGPPIRQLVEKAQGEEGAQAEAFGSADVTGMCVWLKTDGKLSIHNVRNNVTRAACQLPRGRV